MITNLIVTACARGSNKTHRARNAASRCKTRRRTSSKRLRGNPDSRPTLKSPNNRSNSHLKFSVSFIEICSSSTARGILAGCPISRSRSLMALMLFCPVFCDRGLLWSPSDSMKWFLYILYSLSLSYKFCINILLLVLLKS